MATEAPGRSRQAGSFARPALACAMLATAVVIGGGGSPSPASELLLQLVTLGLMLAWLWFPLPAGQVSRDWLLIGAVAAVLLVFLVQLVPLPPALWRNLPGRQVEADALTLVGRGQAWMPLSVSPLRTLASLLSLVPPLGMLFMVSRLRLEERTRLLAAMAMLGVLTCIVGAVQLAGGDDSWARFYSQTHRGYLTGFQANRNATADVLLVAIVALVLYTSQSRRLRLGVQSLLMVGAMVLLMACSVILTGSRAGMGMLGVMALAALVVLAARLPAKRWPLVGAGLAVVLGAGLLFVNSGNSALGHGVARFGLQKEARYDIWADTRYAIGQYWPVGSGVGTFVPVFIAAERLEAVDDSRPNRAHNDYLEFALESGIVGPFLLGAAALALLWRLGTILRTARRARRVQAIFSVAVLAIVAVHSLVDYPLRSMALACVLGLAVGLLADLPRSGPKVLNEVPTS